MSHPGQPVAVLGAGAWGTTLACLQAAQGHPVRLWARRSDFAAQLARDRENRDYLPGTTLPDGVEPTGGLQVALAGAARVIVAVPSHGLREVTRRACEHLEPGALVIRSNWRLVTTLLRYANPNSPFLRASNGA